MTGDDVAGAGASIIPVTDAQAEAITATAQAGKTAIEESGKLGRYVARFLGDVPSNMVEVFIGLHLRFVRVLIADSYDRRISKILERRNAKTEPMSPSVAIPLIQAAYDESRPELQELWAALIAAAMDPARSSRVRLRFIEIVKEFDPLDALLLRQRNRQTDDMKPHAMGHIGKVLGISVDETLVSVENLNRLGCLYRNPNNLMDFSVSSFGKELLRACED